MLCTALANTPLFDDVKVDLSYEHYAEQTVGSLPCFLAMPFNSVVNAGYVLVGLRWLFRDADREERPEERYRREVFALMALMYAPVQWTRLALLKRAPAVLDQWFTLPIFAWVPVWISYVTDRSSRRFALVLELCSVSSYGLALLFDHGFEAALGLHVLVAVYSALQAQRRLGDQRTFGYLVRAVLSCAGFVVLKLLDHWLAQFWLFQRLTGHFWSKVCDVLQFHYSFCFLTTLTQIKHKEKK